jgi:cyclomaltodextrinase / maltogenic alpha-amylase / neopullulanase
MRKYLTFLLLLFHALVLAQNEPDWAGNVVWYQIFPERFHNGDPNNDPRIGDQIHSWPHDTTAPWQIHPWNSDWYELQDYEKSTGKDFWWNVQRRRYGGDLEGILQKLPYLVELGIGAIYLNPLFMAPSHHKYDGAMYHHIEPTFGPDPEGDRKIIAQEDPLNPHSWQWTKADLLALRFIRECHNYNIRIIFDGVFNHLGVSSFAFSDLQRKGRKSIYADWFTVKNWPEDGGELQYEGWFGIPDLPEIREDSNGIVKGPKEYILNCTRRWMDPDGDGNPSDGIDGWRLDVAFCINHRFWKDWRKFVKQINPDAYLTAEVIDSISKVRPYLEGDEFDAVMNYNLGFALAGFFIGDQPMSPASFDSMLTSLRGAFQTSPYIQQNLFDSHDTNRMASHVVNGERKKYRNWGEYFGWSQSKNPAYNTRKPNDEEKNIQKQIIAFMMCYVGAPMFYYGTESGMWGANDPDCRKPMVWPDTKYNPECVNPDQSKRGVCDPVFFDEDLARYIRSLIHLRNSSGALRNGTYKTIISSTNDDLFGFERKKDDEHYIILFNRSNIKRIVELNFPEKTMFKNIFTNQTLQGASGKIKINLYERGVVILRQL